MTKGAGRRKNWEQGANTSFGKMQKLGNQFQLEIKSNFETSLLLFKGAVEQ